MKLRLRPSCEAVTPLRVLLAITCAITIPLLAYAAAPDWWPRRDVIAVDAAPDDYAPANIGQLKKIASSAAAEMDANLPDGAGDAVHNLVNSWASPTAQTNDFVPVNIGQVKNVVRPFYDQLIADGLASVYPWSSSSTPDDFSAANVGQVKNLFAFEIPVVDTPPQNIDNMLAFGFNSGSMALQPTGSVWLWNDHFSNASDLDRTYPKRFTAVRNVNSVAAGEESLAVLRTDGTVWAWGKNEWGELGDGTNTDRSAPAAVPNLAHVTSIKAGGLHVLALLENGTVVAWGCNLYGQLGTGDTTSRSAAVLVPGLNNITKIAAGRYSSAALASDATVWTWGYDNTGQQVFSPTPRVVAGLQDVIDVAAGQNHVVAVKNDGTVWAWGSNSMNQIANGTPWWQYQATPFPVPNLPAITKVASKYDHTLAIAADGTVWAWGANYGGQLGDGTTSPRQTPIQVPGVNDVVAVAADYSYSMAMTRDGTVWAWGEGAPGVVPGANPHLPQQVTFGLLDSNGNGIDDRWELYYFGNLDQASSADTDADGISNLQEFLHHTDPTDYFNGVTPVIEIVSGNNQFGDAGAIAPKSLTVRVRRGNGQLAPNAPVNFSVSSGDAQLLDASGATTQQLSLRTDANGLASVRFAFGQLSGVSSRISAIAGNLTTSATTLFRVVTNYRPPPAATPSPDPNASPTATPDPAATPVRPYRYAIIDLGKDVRPRRINNKGTVLVTMPDENAPDGWGYGRWRAGNIEHLSYGGADSSLSATDMNDDDIVVGSLFPASGPLLEDGPNEIQAGLRWPADRSTADVLSAPDGYLGVGPFDFNLTFKSASLSAVNNANDAYGQIATGSVMGFLYYTVPVMNSAVWSHGSSSGAQLSDMSAANIDGWLFGSRWTGTSDTISRASRTHYIGTKLTPEAEMEVVAWYGVSGTPTGMIDAQSVDFSPIDLNEGGVVIGNTMDGSGMVIQTLTTPPLAPAADVTISNAWPIATNDHVRQPAPQPGATPGPSATPIPAPQILAWDPNTLVLWERQPDASWYPFSVEEMIPSMDGWQIWDAADMNDDGMIAGTALYTPPGHPETDAELHGILLVPMALIVDGNRDGQMSLDNSDDNTSEDRPYRFWLNDDDDTELQINELGGAPLEVETVSTSSHDYDKHSIISKRNLEDFARLWVYLGASQEKLASGEIQVGLRWKTVAAGAPALNIYPSADGEGSDSYLKDETAASAQLQGVFGNAVNNKNNSQTVDSSATFIFKPDYWTGLSGDNPKKCLLFEGAKEGKGELEVVLLDQSDKVLVSGGSVWLDLKNIKKMYERGKANPTVVDPPYNTNSPTDHSPSILLQAVADPNGQPRDFSTASWNDTNAYIIFVHGWNQDYDHSTAYAETLFKRLWQHGYTGRFAAFRWPTYWSNVQLDPAGALNAALARYNDSEYIAWNSGLAFKQFVDSLPGDEKNVVAHSMGNMVVGQALREGAQIQHYAMLHAATSASCYSDRSYSYPRTNSDKPVPEDNPDGVVRSLGYTGWLGDILGQPVNFWDQLDSAVGSAWNFNNAHFKPDSINQPIVAAYSYDPGRQSPWQLAITYLDRTLSERAVTDAAEAKAYVAYSVTGTIGYNQSQGGAVVDSVNDTYFSDDHGAEWNLPVQSLTTFYRLLLLKFEIAANQ